MEQHETEAALLPNIANQMRSLLSNLYLAASQVIPPEQREQDPALDAKAAILEQSFFRLLRLVNSMSAAEYLSDSQTLSLRDADLVKLVSEVCESSADLAEQLGIQLKFVCAMDRRVCAIHPAAVEQMLYHLLSNALKFTPAGGTVTVDGKELSAMRDEELTIFRRRKIGFVFQNYNLVPVLNVYENIVLPIQLDGNAPDKAYVERIIETLGLEAKLQNLPNNLSGGQQQRVAIARALAAKPAIILALINHPLLILADEPTGNLDSATSLDVMGLLKVTAQKFSQTIVMITHNEELAQMADRIIRIEDGRIVVRG